MKTVKLDYDRNALLKVLKDKYGEFETVVELGTNKGAFAKTLFEILDPEYLFAVDPFAVYSGAPPSRGNNPARLKVLAKQVADMLHALPSSGTCDLIRDYSVPASLEFEDDTIDLVYIDADHAYESVKADIEAWFPKVKPGKILAGHDFVPKSSIEKFGVIQAVTEFCNENNYDIKITNDKWTTWMLTK